jgi:hypothetical protein
MIGSKGLWPDLALTVALVQPLYPPHELTSHWREVRLAPGTAYPVRTCFRCGGYEWLRHWEHSGFRADLVKR